VRDFIKARTTLEKYRSQGFAAQLYRAAAVEQHFKGVTNISAARLLIATPGLISPSNALQYLLATRYGVDDKVLLLNQKHKDSKHVFWNC
jgi:hypothetical protein